MAVKTGHFIKAEDGQIYRLVSTSLDGVDKKVVEKVTQRLNQAGVESGSAVWISKPDAEGIFIQVDDPPGSGFDKDKDTP